MIILNEGRVEAYGSYSDVKGFNLGSLDLRSDTDPNQKDKDGEDLEGEACALPAQKSKEASAEDKVKQEVSNNLLFSWNFIPYSEALLTKLRCVKSKT